MSCSSCKYLNECKKSEGAVSGCSYYCSKINSYINGTNSCENYEKTYSRSNYECDKIYNDGKNLKKIICFFKNLGNFMLKYY